MKPYNTLLDILDNAARGDGGIGFINKENEESRISYCDLKIQALKILNMLIDRGIKEGDELIFQIADNHFFICYFWAAILGGMIPVPVTPGIKEEHRFKLFKIWQKLSRPYLITDSSTNDGLRSFAVKSELAGVYEEMIQHTIYAGDQKSYPHMEMYRNIKTGDRAFIQFSSGSTGEPKGVILTHKNLVTNIKAIIAGAEITSKDSSLSWMPLTHDMGLIGFHLTTMAAGINQWIMSTNLFIRRPLSWMEKAASLKITLLASPNFGYNYFLKYFKPEKAEGWDFSHVRLIFNGAEPISPALCRRFQKALTPYHLKEEVMFPVYGLAEASLAVTFPPVDEKIKPVIIKRTSLYPGGMLLPGNLDENDPCFVDLGYPVNGCSVKIADEKGDALTENRIGRVLIKGANVTGGYYRDQGATEKAISGGGWLDTGDLGFLKERRLGITGRRKDIIFINGQNYYPRDPERIVESLGICPMGAAAACGVFDGEKEELFIFIMTRMAPENFIPVASKVREEIFGKLGIMAAKVIPVKRFPRTTSGKLRRHRLVENFNEGAFDQIYREMESLAAARKSSAPQSSVEKKLLPVIKEILEQKNLGITDNLFELGMDSLKGGKLAAQLEKIFSIHLELNILFEYPGIRELAAYIEKQEEQNFDSIPREIEKEHYELSSAQSRLYALQQIEEESTLYNIPAAMTVYGPLDHSRLEEAFRILIRRHQSLRTAFHLTSEGVVQKFRNHYDFKIEHYNLSDAKDYNLQCSGIIERFIRPFDLTNPPLIRVALIQRNTIEHLFLIDIHHIVSDGTSGVILAKELALVYGRETLLPLKREYKDFVFWHNRKLSSKEILKQKRFWLDQFKGPLPDSGLPVDFPKQTRRNTNGKDFRFIFQRESVAVLKETAGEYKLTLYMILFAAFFILLFKYTRREDIVIGTPAAGRRHPDTEGMVGMFVNTLAIRLFPGEEKTLSCFFKEVKKLVLQALDNQDYPFEALIHELYSDGNSNAGTLFDTMFVLQNMGKTTLKAGDVRFESYDLPKRISKFDLTLFAEEREEGLAFEFEYPPSLFKEETIASMSRHYLNILNAFCDCNKTTLGDIDILTEDEKDFLVFGYNRTTSPYPSDKSICRLFEIQTAKTPVNIALEHDGHCLSYDALNRRVNSLARLLMKKGVASGSIVAIMGDISIEAVVAILAVLKTGGAYLPIDPAYPQERVRFMLEDSGVDILLAPCCMRIEGELKLTEIIRLDDEGIYEEEADNPGTVTEMDDTAYIIYTSGSTGKPKGVMVHHRGLTNYIYWAKKVYFKDENEAMPLYTSLGFDLTVTTLFAPLICGGRIVIYPPIEEQFILHKILEEKKVSTIKLSPAHLSLLTGRDWRSSSVKRFIVGGEDLKSSLARDILKSFGKNIEIYNEYGPTETVVGCMIHRYDFEKDLRSSVPIGIPADNVQIYLLDQKLKPLFREGEIYISGDGVASGYRNRDALTREKFLPHPFIKGKKIYKTGDLGRFIRKGLLEYVGRIDHQVKINGHRIEPGEIEGVILQSGLIREVVVIERKNEDDKFFLCAYVVPGNNYDSGNLKFWISSRLPDYMMPRHFICLEEIPLTINGKVDRLKLPAPEKMSSVSMLKPESDIEKILLDFIEKTVAPGPHGMDTNFFHIGGDSIKAIRLMTALRDKGFKLKVKDILEHPFLKNMVKQIVPVDKKTDCQQVPCEGDIENAPITDWFFSRGFFNEGYYNQSVLLEAPESLKKDDLTKAWHGIIKSHDALRLNLRGKSKKLFYNSDHLANLPEIKEYELSKDSYPVQCEKIEEICKKLKSNFDLQADLLIKAAVINLGPNGKRLFFTAHHLVVDGVSWQIILEELGKRLNSTDAEATFGVKTDSYGTWTARLKEYNRKKIYSYRDNEEIIPAIAPDYGKTGGTGRNTIKRKLTVKETGELVFQCNYPYGTETRDLLLTALVQSLGRKRVTIGMEGHGRNEVLPDLDISLTVGWFTTIYPLTLEISEGGNEEIIPSVKEQLRNVPDDGMGGGFHDLCEEKYIRFNYLGDFDPMLAGTPFKQGEENTGGDICPSNRMTALLAIDTMIINKELTISFTYSPEVFLVDTIIKTADNYLSALREIIGHCRDKKDKEFTPSDFSMLSLSREDLDHLLI